jgi:hypothetical protein
MVTSAAVESHFLLFQQEKCFNYISMEFNFQKKNLQQAEMIRPGKLLLQRKKLTKHSWTLSLQKSFAHGVT